MRGDAIVQPRHALRRVFSMCICLSPCALAASPPRSDGIDRSHPLGLEYTQPYGILGMDYETPHVKWGKPLAGGPIDVLVMAPEWTHRETVELAQRLDVRFAAWMCHTTERMHAKLGEQPLPGAETIAGLLSEKLEADHDAIVIGKLRWSMLPAKARRELLAKVRAGTGLVYVCPPEIEGELATVFANPCPGRVEILSGVPWWALPRLRETDPGRLVRTGTHGKGRVVVLDYQQPRAGFRTDMFGSKAEYINSIDMDLHCLTPTWVQVWRKTDWPRGEEGAFELGPYEYYQSLVARAVRWAAGRSSSVVLEAAFPLQCAAGERIPVSIAAKGSGPIASISLAVRTDGGRKVFDRGLQMSGAGNASVDVPALCAGRYVLDLWARDARGGVLEWASRGFEVGCDNAIEKIELDTRLLEAGDNVRAKVQLAKPLAAGQKMRAELWDAYGRRIAASELVPSDRSAAIDLGPLAPVHTMHELRVIVSRAGAELIDHRYQFPVRVKALRDDFASVVWVNECARNSLPGFYMHKKLREVDRADVAYSLPGSWAPREEMVMRARQAALSNLMIFPYNGGFGPLQATEGTHVSTRCLADPTFIESIGKQYHLDAEVYAPYGPFAWTHGGESRYSNELDMDWHPAALARFRRLLAERLYPNLKALNDEWGTQYRSWGEVMPIEFAQAKKTGNFPPWVTHKLSSDVIYAEIYKHAGDVIRQHDPGARTGLDGDLGLYGANYGYDWWLLSKNIQLFQSYHSHVCQDMQSAIKRSFSGADAGTVRGMWYGTYGMHNAGRPSTVEYCHYHPWYSLFHQMNTDWWWTMGAPGPLSGYAPDLTSLPHLQARTRALAEIKSGIGKLVLSARMDDDRIAIHFSESSRIIDSLYSEKSDPWNCDYEDAIGNVARALEDVGFQYRFVAYEEIERGELGKRGYRVLFLPHSRAVSDLEAAKIIEFVRDGGVVIADILPGILTPTGGKRPASALGELFPKDKPGAVVRHGRGSGIIVGADFLKGYYRLHNGTAGWPSYKGRWREMADLLETQAGIKPAVVIESKQGDMPPTEIGRFHADGIELVGLLRSAFVKDNDTYPARIRLPRKAHLYDVRAGAYLGHSDRCDRAIDYQAELLAMSPYKVKSVRVESVGPVAAGKPLRLKLVVEAASGRVEGRHVLRMTVTGPDGQERRWYAQNVLAPGGQATAVVPLALNERAGNYSIRVRDAMSGVTGSVTVSLPGEVPAEAVSR